MAGARKGKMSDYESNPAIWAECILQYTAIYLALFDSEHYEVAIAMNIFNALVQKASHAYEGTKVIEFAMKHVTIALCNRHNASTWEQVPHAIEAAYPTQANFKKPKIDDNAFPPFPA